jgi:2-polyprenyl-3-methyl-5-hydroxy-6-metoxy-1,4-benzoquinol methylase
VTAARGTCIACEEALASHPWTVTAVALYSCPGCGSLTALPRPADESQRSLHDREDYFDHPYFDLRRDGPVTTSRCRQTFARIGRTVDVARLRGALHLDVGCDTGTFLEAAAALFGTRPTGIDVSRRATEETRRRGIAAFCCSLESLDPSAGPFDLITAIDVLEHVPDPLKFLRAIRGRLNAGGILYLETPNIASVVYDVGRILGLAPGLAPRRLRERLFPAEHVQYFTKEGLSAVLARSGLTVIDGKTRSLSASDLSASWPTRTAVVGLQLVDRIRDTHILHWTVAGAAG